MKYNEKFPAPQANDGLYTTEKPHVGELFERAELAVDLVLDSATNLRDSSNRGWRISTPLLCCHCTPGNSRRATTAAARSTGEVDQAVLCEIANRFVRSNRSPNNAKLASQEKRHSSQPPKTRAAKAKEVQRAKQLGI